MLRRAAVGKGTGLAIVGAYVLAGELAAAGGDHRAAFGRYERLLQPYVAKGQNQARGSKDFLAPSTQKKITQLYRIYKVLPYLPVKRLMKYLTTRTAAYIKLPDGGADDPRQAGHDREAAANSRPPGAGAGQPTGVGPGEQVTTAISCDGGGDVWVGEHGFSLSARPCRVVRRGSPDTVRRPGGCAAAAGLPLLSGWAAGVGAYPRPGMPDGVGRASGPVQA